MKKIILLSLALFCSLSLFAQRNHVKPNQRIQLKSDSKTELEISKMDVNVEVIGNIATTTYDITFKNNTNRILEGDFEFPLGDGQTISSFALDINGELREGVVVEKEKGRQVFETVVRNNVDPGLLEVTQGNNFKTRVYPIPANGSRQLRISYEEVLTTDSGDLKYTFYPLLSQKIKDFSFNVKVLKTSDKPQRFNAYNKVISFNKWQEGYSASFSEKNFYSEKPVTIYIPVVYDSNSKKNLYTQEKGKDTYFYYFNQLNAEPKQKKAPGSVYVLFDVSSSGKNRDIEKEIDLLTKYLQNNKRTSVTIATFSNEIHATKNFSASDSEGIRKYLMQQKFDGATSGKIFSGLKKNTDEILLFSDGIFNWGNDAEQTANCPVYTINSSGSGDFGTLKNIARKNNGNFIDLVTTEIDEALELLTTIPLRLVKVEYDNKAVSEVYPLPGTIVSKDFSVAGILRRKAAIVRLSLGYGNEIKETITLNLSSTDNIADSNKAVIRMWAQKKIEELNIDYEKNKQEIIDTAKEFSIVTKDTSLLVLDNISDYFRYNVPVPEKLMKTEEYENYVKNNQRPVRPVIKPDQGSSKINHYFDEFKKWWNTKKKDFKHNRKNKGNASEVYELEAEAEIEMPVLRMDNSANSYYLEDSVVAESAPRRLNEASRAASEQDLVSGNGGRNSSGSAPAQASIQIKEWNPDREYLAVLKRTKTAQMYDKYLELKKENENSPSFFMEVASYFMEENLEKEAIRIVSNLAEMNLENTDVLRALGNKLVEFKKYELAADVFKKLTELRSEIPQFYRDLGLAYAECGKFQEAADVLYRVVTGKWDDRYSNIEMIALNDLNSVLVKAKNKVDTSKYDQKLLEKFPVDLRVVLTWNTDDCDIDLWVTDPNNEKCFYSNKLTQNGGRISRDFTQGYGPEEFCIKEADAGNYKIEVNYYGTRSQKLLQPVIVQAEVYSNFGTEYETKEVLTLQLDTVKGTFTVGTINVK